MTDYEERHIPYTVDNDAQQVTGKLNDDLISRAEAIRIASGYCHPANIAKELERLPSIDPKQAENGSVDVSGAENAADRTTDDLISRQAAIDAMLEAYNDLDAEWILKRLPSVQPVRKGKWVLRDDSLWCTHHIYNCSLCGNFLDFYGVNAGRGDANYCPNCGADMREDTDEQID